jgi:hypothetical protein
MPPGRVPKLSIRLSFSYNGLVRRRVQAIRFRRWNGLIMSEYPTSRHGAIETTRDNLLAWSDQTASRSGPIIAGMAGLLYLAVNLVTRHHFPPLTWWLLSMLLAFFAGGFGAWLRLNLEGRHRKLPSRRR